MTAALTTICRLFLVALILPSAAYAQQSTKSSLRSFVVFGVAASADWASTGYAFAQNGKIIPATSECKLTPPLSLLSTAGCARVLAVREQNPLISGLQKHPAAMIAAGAGIDVAYAYGLHRVFRHHPRLKAAALYSSAAFRVYLAAKNLRGLQAQGALKGGAR